MGDVEDTPGFIAYWIFMSFMLSLFVVAVIGHCVMGKIENLALCVSHKGQCHFVNSMCRLSLRMAFLSLEIWYKHL